MKILILCTGNSCRSQMAHGILKSLVNDMHVTSAGTSPAAGVHPVAVQVMAELGIDISAHQPVHVNTYIHDSWDFVITVCDSANETCPVFTGPVKNRLHLGFEDPAAVTGTQTEVLEAFRKTRDLILRDFFTFRNKYLSVRS